MALDKTQSTDGQAGQPLAAAHLERGMAAVGPDGPFGTIEQIVVERGTGTLRSLIIRGTDSGAEFELPATHVDTTRTTARQVFFDIGRADLAKQPGLAAPYDPDQYVPVYRGEVAPHAQAARVAMEQSQPVVTDVEQNAAEVILPETTGAATTRPLRRTDERAATPHGETGAAPMRREGMAERTQPAATPARQPSTQQSTTGELVGGKPSTSGMGSASTVPASTAADQPRVTMRRDSTAAPEDRGYEDRSRDVRAVGETTDVLPVNPSPQAIQAQEVADQLIKPGELPRGARTPDRELYENPQKPLADRIDSSGQTTWSTPANIPEPQPDRTGAAVVGEQLPVGATLGEPTRTVPPRALRGLGLEHEPAAGGWLARLTTPLTLGLAGLGLGGGALIGVLAAIRQRRTSPSHKAKSLAGNLADAASSAAEQARSLIGQSSDSTSSTVDDARKGVSKAAARFSRQAQPTLQGTAKQAQKSATRTGRAVRKGTKRTARRARWFRNGLVIGAVSAVLFAPESGAAVREQLARRVDEWRSRAAS